MIIVGDRKAKGQKMMIEKINELDQLLLPASQMIRAEAEKVMKKTKNNSEGWIPIGKNMKCLSLKWFDMTCLPL